ncbi:ABC-three component system protein [Chishuiella sp.]|uniref:ABC-three component system protein n=1 Tax=Chishuiella sp. TaxID=1969467 RepID=UPI0028AFC9EC|nr:ABC-three component system protein [Chishuiella sp.]
MNNRNATASWSGYSHQGQVGLLVALRKLQEPNIDLSNYFVEFENTEDVAIYELTQVGEKNFLSVHQVKAYYSDGNRQNNYIDVFRGKSIYETDAEGKYVKDANKKKIPTGNYESGQWCSNDNYLHTVVEVVDWDNNIAKTTDTIPIYIKRYPYSTTQFHCDTTEVEDFVLLELNKIFPANPSQAELAYKKLSFELDNRIRNEHKKASKALFDIKFSLQEIADIINDQSLFKRQGIYECRKIFYETFIEVITEDSISDEKRDFLENGVVKEINDLDDDNFKRFLQYLNICEPIKDLDKSQILANKDGLDQVFFHLLIEVLELEPLQEQNLIKYRKDNLNSNFVITSIIKEPKRTTTVVKNIIENLESMSLLWENHQLINKEINADFAPNIPSFRDNFEESEESKKDRDRFMYYSNTKLISRENAIQLLNDTNNN